MHFESITLRNLFFCLALRCFNREIYYFGMGRILRRIPLIRKLPSKYLMQVQYQISDYPGLSFEIHNNAITEAENLHALLLESNFSDFEAWSKKFKNEKIHIYTKKSLAIKCFEAAKKYLILTEFAKSTNANVIYHADHSPINQLLIPRLKQRYGVQNLTVKGLNPSLFKRTGYCVSLLCEVSLHISSSMIGRRIKVRTHSDSYKVSKEILWEIGTGRRNDDFFVDGIQISHQDVLFYYRNSSTIRVRAGYLDISIANAIQLGYGCVNFDKTPLSLVMIFKTILPRYVIYYVTLFIKTILNLNGLPEKRLFLSTVSDFLAQSIGWDIFLSSYKPAVNLSQEDPYPSHISDTIILNYHGCKNAGFQWGDDTQWRATTLSYLGYDIYFSWGPIAQKYWADNWEVDSIISTGYLWGHHVEESLSEREFLRRKFVNNYEPGALVISLLDEKITPDLYTSKKMLYDFYALGVELIKRRKDVRIIAKPKRWSHDDSGVPEIDDLIAPYVTEGSFTLLGRENVDVQEIIALTDVMVSMVMGVPYLEAICCGTTGFNFAPSRNIESPVYKQGYGTVVFDNIQDLANAIEFAIDNQSESPGQGIIPILNDIDPYRDLRGIDRLRQALLLEL